jgi:hypothetical protein
MTGRRAADRLQRPLKKLVSNTGSGISTAVSLIGKDVSAVSNDAQLSNGKADWLYKLKLDAADTKIEGAQRQGRDRPCRGRNRQQGRRPSVHLERQGHERQQDAGRDLHPAVTAKDSTGAAVTSTTYVQGRVTGVEQLDGSTYITVNGGKISWDTVTSVKEGAATPAATDTTTTPPATT